MTDKLKLEGVLSMGYGIIPKLVMKDACLTIEAKAIYSYLCSYAGGGDTAFPSVELICNDLGISQNRYLKHRKHLIEKGYITIKRERKEKGWSNNIYTISHAVHIQNVGIRNVGIQSIGIQNEGTNKNIFNNNNLNNTNNKIPSPTASVDSDFDKLWSLYPRKEGKKAALKKYREVIKKGTATNKKIQDGIVAYKRHLKAEAIEAKYIKQGGTYFNGECWNDQYEVEKPDNPLEQKFEYF